MADSHSGGAGVWVLPSLKGSWYTAEAATQLLLLVLGLRCVVGAQTFNGFWRIKPWPQQGGMQNAPAAVLSTPR